MAWAIFTTPEDKAEMESAFIQAGLTGGEWNRIRPYAEAFVLGWNANVPVPPEHPCWIHDAATMRTVVMNHGTKDGWLTELTRLINRPQRDRIILTSYRDLMTLTGWYAVPEWPAPAGYFDGMICG
jgi:hypothetical protein